MHSASRRRESGRRKSLTRALNTILLACRSNSCSGALDEALPEAQELIFMRSCPVRTARNTTADSENVVRKPDVVALFTSYLRRTIPDCQRYDFEDWCINQSAAEKEQASEKIKLEWLDVLQPWNVTFSKTTFDTSRLDSEYTAVGMTDLDGSDPSVASPVSVRGEKRKAGSPLQSGSGKRSRSTLTTSAAAVPLSHSAAENNGYEDPSILPSTDEQGAYYAIERLSAAWNITHCTVVQLTGECVTSHTVVCRG